MINTQDKRRSTFGFGVPGIATMPVPNTGIGARDRRHVGGHYRGDIDGDPAGRVHGKQIRRETLELVVFSALVKDTGGDYEDLGAALNAIEASPSQSGVVEINSVVGFGSTPVTLTKPVEVRGITTDAKVVFSTTLDLTVGEAGSLSHLTFKGVEIERTGNGQILFIGLAMLKLIDCVLDNLQFVGEMFDIPQNSTVELTRTSVETIANSDIFATTKYNNRFIFDDCQITDATMLGALINAYGYKYGVSLELKNGTLLQGFQNGLTLEPEIFYDGTSIIIDIDNDITNDADLDIAGEAFFSKTMDDLNANVTVKLCLENWIGPNLVFGDGLFTLSATATINDSAKINGSIRGQGSGYPRQDSNTVGTVINVNSASAVTALAIGSSPDGITISNLQIRLAGAGAHTGISSAALGTTVRDCFIRMSSGAVKGISLAAFRGVIDQCQVLPFTTTAGPLFRVAGLRSVISRCFAVWDGPVVTIGILVTGAKSKIIDNHIEASEGELTTGISASGVASLTISRNNLIGGADVGDDGILLAGVTGSIVEGNVVGAFTDGLDSDATSDKNLYDGNNFQSVTNGVNKDAGDGSTVGTNVTN